MSSPRPASRAALYWALGVIFAANFFNYIDRQLVSALENQLKGEFKLDSFQFGLLWTLFTVGYMVCAVPIGLLADRFSRTRLFAVCIVVWSLATIASGMATTKEVLYASRIFIGVGEAGCLIIGPALISDLFHRKTRGRMLSVFYLALPLGGTAAFILSGLLLDIGWRNLFYLAGAPGFIIALLVWLLRDPPRGAHEELESEGVEALSPSQAHAPSHSHSHGAGGMRQYMELLRTPTLILIILAQAFAVIILIPIVHFGVLFFEENRGMDGEEARISLGIVVLIAGVLGNSLSGIVGDKLSKRITGAYALVAGVGFLAGLPCLMLGFIAESRWVFLPALTMGSFFYFLCMPAVNTQIANVVSPAQRSTAWALAVFILHLLGDTLAPPVFGKVSDTTGRQQAFIYFSLALILAGVCCLIAAATARADVERVAQQIRQEPKQE